MLNGANPSSIKTEAVGFANPRFDWRELQHWNIREADLPAGSQIDFREPSFWRQHRWTVVGVAGVVLMQTLMISALLFERFRRRLAESGPEVGFSSLHR